MEIAVYTCVAITITCSCLIPLLMYWIYVYQPSDRDATITPDTSIAISAAISAATLEDEPPKTDDPC